MSRAGLEVRMSVGSVVIKAGESVVGFHSLSGHWSLRTNLGHRSQAHTWDLTIFPRMDVVIITNGDQKA